MKALIFDLDGTLVDSVYGHVLAFQIAFAEAGIPIEAWRIHRHIGMSGDLLTQAVTRDSGLKASPQKLEAIEKRHGRLLHKLLPKPQPLPGAVQLLKDLRRKGILHGIATSGKPAEMKIALKDLNLSEDTVLVNRHDAAQAKPEPDLFLECRLKTTRRAAPRMLCRWGRHLGSLSGSPRRHAQPRRAHRRLQQRRVNRGRRLPRVRQPRGTCTVILANLV